MTISRGKVEELVSERRFRVYLERCNGNENAAIAYYEANVAVSEASYVCLQSLEIVLRNKIHRILSEMFETDAWYDVLLDSEEFKEFTGKIIEVKKTLSRKKKDVVPSSIIPEFTLGFWVQLFNAEYQMKLWKPLRNIFVNLPKENKQRHVVSAALNKARNYRN